MTIKDIIHTMNQNIDLIINKLLPGGVERNGEYEIGSIHGEAGKSMKIRMRGEKVGIWSDFASGQGGDLLDLWCEKRGVGISEGLTQVKEFLGIQDQRVFQKPRPKPIEKPRCSKPTSLLEKYFRAREINQDTLKTYKIAENNGVIIFPYLNQEGDLLMLKHRDHRDKKKTWTNKDPYHCLFGWQALDPMAREVVLCEGEIDAMSYHEQGIPALSIPFGGGQGGKHQWIDHETENLDRFEKIYVSMDMDSTGFQARQDIIERLGRHRCFVVELPKKDANECLKQGIELREFIHSAKTQDPQSLTRPSECWEGVVNLFYPKDSDDKGARLPWQKTWDDFRFRDGETSVYVGINGHGKSQILGHIITDLMAQGHRALIASMEFRKERLLYRQFRQISGMDIPTPEFLAECIQWTEDKLWLFDASGASKAKDIMEVFQYGRKRYGIRHFVVDSLAKCGFAEDDYSGQKLFVEELTDWARDSGAHVHIVVHPRKQMNESQSVGKMDVKGSGGVTDMVDNVFSVWRNKTKEEMIDDHRYRQSPPDQELLEKPDAILRLGKQRNGDWEGSWALWFDRKSYQYLHQFNASPKRYVNFSALGGTNVA